MFLRFIKEIALKKNIKKSLSNYNATVSTGKVTQIGIITNQVHLGPLVKELTARGIDKKYITSLCFREDSGKEKAQGVFSYADITTAGVFTGEEVKNFIQKPFGLLISYYKADGALPLTAVSVQSAAEFKAGLSGTDMRINSLIIDVETKDYKVFADELFKYLNVLKKI